MKRYDNDFPKIALVQWDGYVSPELIIPPDRDEFLMEGLQFLCPKCGEELDEPYDSIGGSNCQYCGISLWEDSETIPIVQEPKEVFAIFKELEENDYPTD